MGLALQNKKLTAIAIAPFHSKAIALPTLIKSDRSLVEYKNKERSPSHPTENRIPIELKPQKAIAPNQL